jgi:malonyl CoA-acyl carrier protein transacylase
MMTERYCQVCKTYYDGNTTTIELSEDNGKNKIFITGHDDCIDTLYEKMKNVKDLDKKPIKKILKEVKFKLNI